MPILQMKKTHQTRTMEQAVEDRQLPEGDNAQQWATLQTAVLEYVEGISGNLDSVRVDLNSYNQHLGGTISAFYSTAVQGRIGGFATMLLDEGLRIFVEGFGFGGTFKTAWKYGYQPITGSKPAIAALKVKINFMIHNYTCLNCIIVSSRFTLTNFAQLPFETTVVWIRAIFSSTSMESHLPKVDSARK